MPAERLKRAGELIDSAPILDAHLLGLGGLTGLLLLGGFYGFLGG